MTISSFMCHGIGGKQKIYQRKSFPPESNIAKYGNVTSFTGNITSIFQQENSKTFQIDNAYQFTLLSDAIRTKCSNAWLKLSKETKITFTATLIGSLVALTSAIALGVLLSSLWGIALAVGLLSLVLFGVSCWAVHRSKQAQAEHKLWADPAQKYIEMCRTDYFQRQVAEARQQNSLMQQDFIAKKKERLQEVTTKIKDFITQLEEMDPKYPHLDTQIKAIRKDTLWSAITGTIQLAINLGSITRIEAYQLLQPYFNPHPNLKLFAEQLYPNNFKIREFGKKAS